MFWQLLLIPAGLTLLVVLLMGPGMWSSSNDFVLARWWRTIRGHKGGKPGGADKDPGA
jgi:hypothetical protein